jgi:hypothetical protein
MEKVTECSRIMGFAQDWPHWPWTALNRRGVSSKTDDVVPLTGFEPTTAESKVRRL